MARVKKSQVETVIPPEEPQEESSAILPATFENADGPTESFLARIVERYHKPMAEAQVNIKLQFWRDPDGVETVKVGGIARFGKVITIATHMRAAGSPDMRLVVDGTKWDNATLPEREAALDSLLQSREVVTSEKGEVIRDKAKRPKLKRRKPDLILEGFTRVVEEHGLASQEGKQWAVAMPTFEQLPLFNDSVAAESAR